MQKRTTVWRAMAVTATVLGAASFSSPSRAASATVLDSASEFTMSVSPDGRDGRTRTDAEERAPTASSGKTIFRMVWALALVVGLIVGGTYLVRRTVRPRGEMAEPSLLGVVARAPLGPRREVVLLRAAGHYIVVAQTPSSVQSLAHFPIDRTDEAAVDAPDDFAGCLMRQRDASGGDPSAPEREVVAGPARGT